MATKGTRMATENANRHAPTPGPWERLFIGNSLMVWAPDTGVVVAGPIGGRTVGEQGANADLIAAAPALLAVVEQVEDLFAGYETTPEEEALLIAARAAIAAARP